MALGLFSKPGANANGMPCSFTPTGVEPVVSTDIALIADATAAPPAFLRQSFMVYSSPSI